MLTTIIATVSNFFNISNESDTLDHDAKLIKLWLNEYKHTPNTFTTFRVIVLRFYLWIKYNSLIICLLTRQHFSDYIDFLKNPDANWCNLHRHKFNHPEWRPFQKPLSNKSIHRNLTVIKQMMVYLINNGSILINHRNLTLKLPTYLRNIKQNRYISTEEFDKIIDYINQMPESSQKLAEVKVRILWIFKLLFYSGCRRSELTTATMSDILFVNRQLWLQIVGKGNKIGRVPVVNELILSLNFYRDFYKLPSIYKVNNFEQDIPLIILYFTGDKYYHMSPSHLWYLVKSTCLIISDNISDPTLSYKLKFISPHWFRHSAATAQVDAGIDIRVVQQNLRHSLITTTMQYQHIGDDYRHSETNTKFKL